MKQAHNKDDIKSRLQVMIWGSITLLGYALFIAAMGIANDATVGRTVFAFFAIPALLAGFMLAFAYHILLLPHLCGIVWHKVMGTQHQPLPSSKGEDDELDGPFMLGMLFMVVHTASFGILYGAMELSVPVSILVTATIPYVLTLAFALPVRAGQLINCYINRLSEQLSEDD